MGNVLADISKDNTRFTIFENDQVLTADQLNDLFNYLDVQTRLTRTRAIGIGIICGLEIGQLENKKIVVSKGSAITTDGDLLHFDTDQEFDQYEIFEDVNAKYSYFRMDNGQVTNIYVLKNSRASRIDNVAGQSLSTLEQTTNTAIKDYVGVLYLENYKNDPDVCTGTDCDNKGAELVGELKVLLVHKNNMKLLLESVPAINKNYFALEGDITVPRVIVNTGIDKHQELIAAFNDSLTVKEEIRKKLSTAYQVCRLMLEDEFDGVDPTTGWSSLLDQHFNTGTTIYGQYVYDFARDISYAYNEMRETLFSDNMMCCPEVEIFPKHVLMGLVKTASVRQPSTLPTSPIAPPITRANILNIRIPFLKKIKFDIGSLIRRFHPIHIDTEYRHYFYESPILNNKDENMEQTKFCFKRIDSMIKNFKVPTAEELQNVNQSLKIIPSHFEDKPLGERSIPFYYKFDSNIPSNLYWNFKANTRRKENQILYYFSNLYSNNSSTVSPLRFNILPYNFFRVEGHIGFKYPEVEAALNNLILDNNLPINIITVQVENTLETIPNKPWFFPHLHMYEKAHQQSFLSRLDKAVAVTEELKSQDASISPDLFKSQKQNLVNNFKDVADPAFNFGNFRSSVESVVFASADIKEQTKKYAFSNSAIPHDFVNNTDILQKTDVISNIFQEHIVKKKQGLMLGNFMKQNPGLEHAGGVLRGGTFVLVYRTEDQKVVADFMLPYASVDKDVVVDPPVYKPKPIEIPRLEFPLGKLFELKPVYKIDLENAVRDLPKLQDLDNKVSQIVDLKIEPKIKGINEALDSKLAINKGEIESIKNTNFKLFDTVLTGKTNVKTPNGLVVAGKDYSEQLERLQKLQQEVEDLPNDTPDNDRKPKEEALLTFTDSLLKELNTPEVLGDNNNAFAVNNILSNVHATTSIVKTKAAIKNATEVSKNAINITKGFKLNR